MLFVIWVTFSFQYYLVLNNHHHTQINWKLTNTSEAQDGTILNLLDTNVRREKSLQLEHFLIGIQTALLKNYGILPKLRNALVTLDILTLSHPTYHIIHKENSRPIDDINFSFYISIRSFMPRSSTRTMAWNRRRLAKEKLEKRGESNIYMSL